jgi:hypothetical protein
LESAWRRPKTMLQNFLAFRICLIWSSRPAIIRAGGMNIRASGQ